MIPRWVHRIYAALSGYFWLTCEDCGKGFGGHQWNDDRMTRPTGPTSGMAAYCPACARQKPWPYTWFDVKGKLHDAGSFG